MMKINFRPFVVVLFIYITRDIADSSHHMQAHNTTQTQTGHKHKAQ